MSTIKPDTNIEFMANLMQFSPTGPMMQLFTIEGLRKYSEMVLAAPNEQLDNGVVNPESWKSCARDFLLRLDEFQNRKE